MSAIVSGPFRDGNSRLVSGFGTTAGYRMSGIVIQVLMMYIVTRDLLMTSSFLNYYAPILGSIQARMAVALLIGWIALSTRGFGSGFGAFRHWGWFVLGPFGLMVLVEGLVTITAGTDSKPILVVGINLLIFLFSVGSAYLFAIRGRTLTQALAFLIQPFLYLCITVSVLGLAAWLLVHAGGVDPADWYLPDQFAAGRLTNDAQIGYYSSPFYLSGILNQSNGQLLNFSFHRATGLFEEPALAAFFVSPAIFLMPLMFRNRSSRWWLRLGILVIIGFLLVVNSKTNFLVMSITCSIILSRLMFSHPRVRPRVLATLGLLVLSALIWSTFIQNNGIGSEFLSIGLEYVSDLSLSLSQGSFLGPGVFEPARLEIVGEIIPRGLLSWFAVISHISILVVLGIYMTFSSSTKWYIGGALIYLAGHSIKSFGHTATSGYYLYILFVLALTLACYWSARRPVGATAPQGAGEQRSEDPRGRIRMVLPR